MFNKNSHWTFHCFFLFICLHLSPHIVSKAWQIFPPLGLSDLWQEITPPSLIWFSQAELVVESFVSHYTCFSGEGNGTPLQYCFAWKIPWTEEPGRLQSMGSLRVRRDRATSLDFHALEKEMAAHSSVLENPRDGGAWWAAVYGVAQSWTWLKRLSSSSSSIRGFHLFMGFASLFCPHILSII